MGKEGKKESYSLGEKRHPRPQRVWKDRYKGIHKESKNRFTSHMKGRQGHESAQKCETICQTVPHKPVEPNMY